MLNKWKTLPLSSPISSETIRRCSCKRWKCSKSSGLDGLLLSAASSRFFENCKWHDLNPWRKCFCDRWHWVPYSVWVIARRTSTNLNGHKLWKANLARGHSSHFKRAWDDWEKELKQAWDDWEKGLKQAWDRRVEQTQLYEETNPSHPTASPSSLCWHRLFLRQQKDCTIARKIELWWHDCNDQSDGTEWARGSWSRIAIARIVKARILRIARTRIVKARAKGSTRIATLACPRATCTSNLRPDEDNSLGRHIFICDSFVPIIRRYVRTIAISDTLAADSQYIDLLDSCKNSTWIQRRTEHSSIRN